MTAAVEATEGYIALDICRLAAAEAARSGMAAGFPRQEEGEEVAECRICQEDDRVSNLESPCACSGSLKHAHRACVQRWCDEKGDTTCEICHEAYEPGYTAPPRASLEETTIDVSDGWTLTGSPSDLQNPTIISIARNHIMEAEYEEYASTTASTSAFCRSAILFFLALLLLRHIVALSEEQDNDTAGMISLFLLRAAGFFLPFYIMAWAVSILQRHRAIQERLYSGNIIVVYGP